MSELPEIPREEIYKSLYEKVSQEASEFREQVVSLEILATKLRDERDLARSKYNELLQSPKKEPTEVIEGDLVE